MLMLSWQYFLFPKCVISSDCPPLVHYSRVIYRRMYHIPSSNIISQCRVSDSTSQSGHPASETKIHWLFNAEAFNDALWYTFLREWGRKILGISLKALHYFLFILMVFSLCSSPLGWGRNLWKNKRMYGEKMSDMYPLDIIPLWLY